MLVFGALNPKPLFEIISKARGGSASSEFAVVESTVSTIEALLIRVYCQREVVLEVILALFF